MSDHYIIAGLCIACLATLLSTLALGLDYWEIGRVPLFAVNSILYVEYYDMRAGLWYEYRTYWGVTDPEYKEGVLTYIWRKVGTDSAVELSLLFVRIFMFIASCSLATSAICLALKLVLCKTRKVILYVTNGLVGVAGALLVSSLALYAQNIKNPYTDHAASFYIDIAAAVLSVLLSLILLLVMRLSPT